MKKLIVVLFVLFAANANAFTFVKSVSMSFDDSVLFDIVDFCLDAPNQNQCVTQNANAAKRLYKKVFQGYDSDLQQIVSQCENKYFPDFRKIELCSM